MVGDRGFSARLRSLLSRLYRSKEPASPDIGPAPGGVPAAHMSSSSDSGCSSSANTPDGPAPFICVPLYIYPAPGAWGPLVRAARDRPEARFHAIVNPRNGPGEGELPDENYVKAVRELSALPNVKVLGYVHVTYGRRDAQEVRSDVDRFAAWRGHDECLKIDGIFFDEAPAEVGMMAYMADASRHAKRSLKEANGRRGIVMLNPGVVVPRSYYDIADFVVAFEQAHRHWKATRADFLEAIDYGMAAKTVVMVHSCRSGNRGLEELARGFKERGIRGQYVTEQMEGGYSKWSSWWDRYVDFVFSDVVRESP
ncbi:hypothetical protein VUR80DRAFT_2290 [Thermomyces stellatus]